VLSVAAIATSSRAYSLVSPATLLLSSILCYGRGALAIAQAIRQNAAENQAQAQRALKRINGKNTETSSQSGHSKSSAS
jgi:hypothetical protein